VSRERNVCAIVGSRDWEDLDKVRSYVDTLPNDTLVVSGGARGVDCVAEVRAEYRGLRTYSYRPKQTERGMYIIEMYESGRFDHTHGRVFSKFAPAAFFRNGLIVDRADWLVAFQRDESRGTQDSINRARTRGIDVVLFEERS
jgi:hypothetical protein